MALKYEYLEPFQNKTNPCFHSFQIPDTKRDLCFTWPNGRGVSVALP